MRFAQLSKVSTAFSRIHSQLPTSLHSLIRAGDLPGLRTAIDHSPERIDAFDRHGHTPLMIAVTNSNASVELVAFLIEKGAQVSIASCAQYEQGRSVLSLAIQGGDPRKVALLIENSADVSYVYSASYDALLDVVHSRNVEGNSQLVPLIRLLIANGAALNTVSSHDEAALSGLSCCGRFDAVQALLDAGAEPSRLGWTALHRAVALGTLEQVREALVDRGADIERRDRRNRTPFLLAVQTGDVAKAKVLIRRGANFRATGHCGIPALFLAIENRHMVMFDWLLRTGADMEHTDDFGVNSLIRAAEFDNSFAVRGLLAKGAKLEVQNYGRTALGVASSRDVIICLLDAGADPQQLKYEGQRILIGLGETCDELLLDISGDQFRSGRSRRFGVANPEKVMEPFWEKMIRAGMSAYEGAQICSPENGTRPVWCANRFGQSLTRLPDGRIVQIGGEHEDSYDEDFCIYNDVFVHHPTSSIDVFCYPADAFPPTDFHSASLIGKYIYIIGSLGYSGARNFGHTPVYRLDSGTFRIERVNSSGRGPGWIFGHMATQISEREIRVADGTIAMDDGGRESHVPNDQVFIFDTQTLTWRREPRPIALSTV